jgi:hypothetical protein
MMRARDRDQRLEAGAELDPWMARMCIESPLG